MRGPLQRPYQNSQDCTIKPIASTARPINIGLMPQESISEVVVRDAGLPAAEWLWRPREYRIVADLQLWRLFPDSVARHPSLRAVQARRLSWRPGSPRLVVLGGVAMAASLLPARRPAMRARHPPGLALPKSGGGFSSPSRLWMALPASPVSSSNGRYNLGAPSSRGTQQSFPRPRAPDGGLERS
jgi:hypothetical protein